MLDDLLLPLLRNWSPLGQGALCGLLVAVGTAVWTRIALRQCGAPSTGLAIAWGAVAGGLTCALSIAILDGQCQSTPEVRPTELWQRLRPVAHGLLLMLLAVATATDLRTCYILDAVTLSGMVAGVALATLSGDLQLCHLWVDWNAEVPQLRGPYIPDWLAPHPHLHGLAWSVAGLLLGGGITWAARGLASRLLGQEALGFGDVTLMAMIGAFLGWQATLLVFLLAPVCALGSLALIRICSSRTYVPYGPFLSLAAVLTLFNWQRLWMLEIPLTEARGAAGRAGVFALRRLFGDPVGLLILAGLLAGGLVLLLGLWRIYQLLPATAAAQQDRHCPADGTTRLPPESGDARSIDSAAVRAADSAGVDPAVDSGVGLENATGRDIQPAGDSRPGGT